QRTASALAGHAEQRVEAAPAMRRGSGGHGCDRGGGGGGGGPGTVPSAAGAGSLAAMSLSRCGREHYPRRAGASIRNALRTCAGAMYDTLPSSAATAPLDAKSAGADAHWRVGARNAFPFIVVGGAWEIVAHLGIFPPRLFPPLEAVATTFVQLTVKGILLH